MSRSGYSDDGPEGIEGTQRANCYIGAVRSALLGKRGQALLREMREALDAMPVKTLIAEELVRPSGEVCALGAVGVRRDLPGLDSLDEEEHEDVARAFNVAEALVREIAYENDEMAPQDPAGRWTYMRQWVEEQIVKEPRGPAPEGAEGT